jgi:hypothetical protein
MQDPKCQGLDRIFERLPALIAAMFKAAVFVFVFGVATTSHGAEPILDNERVTVWDTSGSLPPAQHDFVAVSLSHNGAAVLGQKGEVAGKTAARTVVIELKDHPLPSIANTSSYPLAFPRHNAKKLLENDKVVVWDNVWHTAKPTPMHFHDKDALVVYEATGTLQSISAGRQASSQRISLWPNPVQPSRSHPY